MTNTVYKEIGQRIRHGREKLNLSQEELAQRLNYKSAGTISYFETGERKISITDLQQIAAILGLPLEYFLSGEPDYTDAGNIQFRAREVRPTARKVVGAFLSFARQHGSANPKVEPELQKLSPGYAADKVLKAVGVTEPPILPHQIAAHFGVPVFDWEFPDEISGIFVSDEGRVCIGVNATHPRVRQRFTIAHELGHLIYGEANDLFVDSLQGEVIVSMDEARQQNQEKQANQFAADLLMPRSWLREDISKGNLDTTLLAKRYEVSEQSLWFRLLALKLVQ